MSMAAAAAPAAAPLPEWLTSPTVTVIQVEVLVVSAAVLLFLQLIFGFFRQRSSNMVLQGGLWLAYTASFPVVAYTLGVIQASPVKSQLYPVWAISLFLVAGCTNSITVYDPDDNKQWKQQLVVLAQHYAYACLIIRLFYPARLSIFKDVVMPLREADSIIITCCCMFAIILYSNMLRVIACWMTTFSEPSKVVADYMRDQADESRRRAQLHPEEYDPVTMKGYRYLVRWRGYSVRTHDAKAANYRNKLAMNGAITVDMIWESCGAANGSISAEASQTRDVCLSFALFHLLKRRFFGLSCCEADLPETRDFVLRGLLSSSAGDHAVSDAAVARAFRIIEVELAFLHDFFFTKYAAIYENVVFFFLISVVKITLTATLGVFVYNNSLELKTITPIIRVYPGSREKMITLAMLGALVMVELLQAMLYLASDWALVTLACSQVGGRSCRPLRSLRRRAVWMLRRLRSARYWQNKIGQYSVIEGCSSHKSPLEVLWKDCLGHVDILRFLLGFVLLRVYALLLDVIWKVLTGQYCGRAVASLKTLPGSVKHAVALSLVRSSAAAGGGGGGFRVTGGEASLRRNGVHGRFSWMLGAEDRSTTDTMLIWHVATGYLEVALPRAAGDGEQREVSTVISRYAAHLMAFKPDLLPGSSVDTLFMFDKVMEEAAAALHPAGQETLLHRLRSYQTDDGTIFSRGVKLGRELEKCGADGVAPPWKVLAEFWAEVILYVAPSDNVRGHVELLANGGEFITHVWALLTHAGVLPRPRRQAAVV